ncbi:MAG: GNAT family N-acetyltransferase [Brachymonas sp.]|nr:GNAT family N-acetyltransferase [Brachymonas sp.]
MQHALLITHLPQAQRFEAVVDGHTAYASYLMHGNTLRFMHTVVPQPLGGRGIGSALVKHVLDHAAQCGYRIDPQCSFVRAYIERHPGYRCLLESVQNLNARQLEMGRDGV